MSNVIKPIAHIYTDLKEKFGVPRQSGLAESLSGRIVFEPEFRVRSAFRGLEGFSHIWIIWDFSESKKEDGKWQATVRPPALGGNKRMGVFATRSPFRPNGIGLSSVRLDKIDHDVKNGPVLYVSGIDMTDGTPVYDIKPYIPYADSHPEATDGFLKDSVLRTLKVSFPEDLAEKLPAEKREALCEILSLDPAPAYQRDPERVYGMEFAGFEVRFQLSDDEVTVISVSDSTSSFR